MTTAYQQLVFSIKNPADDTNHDFSWSSLLSFLHFREPSSQHTEREEIVNKVVIFVHKNILVAS